MNYPSSRSKSHPSSTSATPSPDSAKSGKKTARKLAPEKTKAASKLHAVLKEGERLQQAILNGICDPAWMKTRDGTFLAVNRAWCDYMGKTEAEAVGAKDSDLFGVEVSKKFRHHDEIVFQSGKPFRFEEFVPGHGCDAWFDTVLSPLTDPQGQTAGIVGIARDITKRKQIEEKFLRSQRMESIGALAGGIAHDLNNILGPIMMSASMLQEPQPPETHHELVSAIQEAAQRGADIVRQLLNYTRGTKNEQTQLNASQLVFQVEKILKEILPRSVRLGTSIPDDLWSIVGNHTRLQQVLVNLCVNARDAMPQGGSISLEAANCEITPWEAAGIPDAYPGRFVQVDVVDNGAGIPQEMIKKIFEPFFTTKEPGKGTGLGLSTVKEIVQSHGGFITVVSKTGLGSKFSIYLPAVSRAAASPAAPVQTSPGFIPHGKGERVLVVDDELPICKMVETILNSKKYEAVKASSAQQALEIYAKERDSIQAILTDIAMPDLDGVALTCKLKEINPDVIIIASTGQPLELRQKELGEMGVEHFLAKPYSAHQLLEIVQKVLAPQKKA